jgi:DUF1365 family protein
MHSAIYQGWVRHRRYTPVTHKFRYRLFMMYLDLDELDSVFRHHPLWSTRHFALAQFRRRDHLGSAHLPLAAAVRDLVEQHSGQRPAGPIRLLTHLRYFGYRFNPISLYYCYQEDGATLHTVVAEVSNTPWGDQHPYILSCEPDRSHSYHSHADKLLHVSPFMPMAMHYRFRLTAPARRLLVHIENRSASGVDAGQHDPAETIRPEPAVFDATLLLERREITSAALTGVLIRYPLMTVLVIAAIHYQAVKLWWRGCPFFSHPRQLKHESNGVFNEKRGIS